MPNGTYQTRSATTNTAGYFNYTFAPDASGKWNVTTSWSGDGETQGATSSTTFFTVEAEDTALLTLPILLIVPIVAVLLIIVGVGLGRSERRPVGPPLVPVSRFPPRFTPRMPRRLTPMRPRVLPARVCPGCGGQLVYSSQYQRWYCPRCRRYT